MEKTKDQDLFNKFEFFHMAFKFEENGKSEDISNLLSNLSLSNFERVKPEYDFKKIEILEEVFPELIRSPHLIFRFKNTEVFLSKKKITITYPKEATGLKFVPKVDRRYFGDMTKKGEKIKVDDLRELDSFIKMFIISDLMRDISPKLNEVSVIFQLKLDNNPNLDVINETFEGELFKTQKFILDEFNFEVTEDKNRFYYSIKSDDTSIMCSFLYDKNKFSLLKNSLEDIINTSYKYFTKIMDVLNL